MKVQEKVNEAIPRLVREVEPKELQEASMHLIRAGGKRLRPFLTIKSCELMGGKADDVIPFAVALELLHNFTLIHDDIMDRSRRRRGIPTVHLVWGIPMAITAGDLLFAKVYESALKAVSGGKTPLERSLPAFNTMTEAIIAVCEGQAYDLTFAKRTLFAEEDCLKLMRLKTAALLEASTKIGALIGGGSAAKVERLASFGQNLGIAFQIRDDVLGLVGDENVTKKPVGDDIREGKKTLIVAHALRVAKNDQRDKILSTLGKKKAGIGEIASVIELLKTLGGVNYANKRAEDFMGRAKADLGTFPDSNAKRSLLELCDFITSRAY